VSDGLVVAEIIDTGAGIAPALLDRIFEPFFTTKEAGVGTGLGLAISRNIVRGFGGDIRVESTPGGGTRFVVSLPAAPSAVAHSTTGTPLAPDDPAGLSGRLLVVDDEEAMRRMYVRQFGSRHVVVTAASGLEAQAILARDRDFDVILCDVMMQGMTGTDLHATVSGAPDGLGERFVFLTGGAFTSRSAEYLASVPNLRLEKPVEPARLQQAIADGISRRRAAEEGS
jgi:CheY-like chemotaxis protein